MSDQIMAYSEGSLGVLGLNRPEALNALSYEMLRDMEDVLLAWREDSDIRVVFLHSTSSKAFCAGGDVKTVVSGLDSRSGLDQARKYFEQEYRVDHLLHTYSKPIVCWGEAWVLGGGWGLFAGCSHRVVMANTGMGMPEAAIGFFPDVGATWFLKSLPKELALFICLTGVRVTGEEAFTWGLADYYLGAQKKGLVVQEIADLPYSLHRDANDQLVGQLLQSKCKGADIVLEHKSDLEKLPSRIDVANAEKTFENICKWKPKNPNWRKACESYSKASPYSIAMIHQMFQTDAEIESVQESLNRDLKLALHFVGKSDFREGVSSKLIHKRPAQWKISDFKETPENELKNLSLATKG